ncbi:hypothetical protein M0811_06436 [Anaeramoeba ignava]|uniref:Fibronectin type-III domain-containing protein n=1 Tax=Anaeramoeba ignava TaxID=1746090 RepID=A0A9Q0RDC1_ANAIG|nr:hypothetical protein M0811_06436 [Anaeramoeba ignava]
MKINLIILIFLINFIFSFQNDIYWNETQILIANDGKEKDYFGSIVRIKGNISVISAHFANVENNIEQGKAYIFENNGTNWNQKQILIANDGEENDQFGLGIAISNDEKYIFIGSPFAKVGNTSNQGKVYIYENNGTFYNLKQILIANDGKENDQFGCSISISNDSSFIVIGAYYSTIGNNTRQGKAYIFQNNGTFWNQYQILIANDGKINDQFGSIVVISNDSSLIFIGSPFASIQFDVSQGKVYIFQNNGTFWNQYQILIANNEKIDERFGSSISLSQNFLLIGAYCAKDGEDISKGKAYIFQNNGTFWNKYQVLIASDGEENDGFGFDVSISNNFAVIGAPHLASGGYDNIQGKAYIFQNNGTYWNQYQILIASDGKEDNNQFGLSKAYIFEPIIIPQVDILNCSSLFSSFECYWNQINSSLNDIEYQINYQNEIQNWEVIQSPILIENVLYQIFNSSIYQDIKGNVDYSIQIKACDNKTQICGNSSNQINLTTKIDSVKNLNFESYSNSIQLNWNYPNVPIINSIPKLNHYFLSYQIQDSNQSTNVSISNSSTSFQINNLESSTNYLISIYGCITKECLADDKGEITTIQIQTLFGSVMNLTCSISNIYDISCIWNKPINLIFKILIMIFSKKKINSTYFNFKFLKIQIPNGTIFQHFKLKQEIIQIEIKNYQKQKNLIEKKL